jgi:pyruvate dehydrogenase E1 component beta subunit
MWVRGNTLRFNEAVNAAMRKLAAQPNALFVGQSVEYDGAAMHASLDGVPMRQRLEMPVAEDFQVGFCIGLALKGMLPICMFPRFDFVLLAANQLVNHLDKLPRFGWYHKVIIRTVVGQKTPLDAGPQHTQDHTAAFSLMLKSVDVARVSTPAQVEEAYDLAIRSPRSMLIVEHPGL